MITRYKLLYLCTILSVIFESSKINNAHVINTTESVTSVVTIEWPNADTDDADGIDIVSPHHDNSSTSTGNVSITTSSAGSLDTTTETPNIRTTTPEIIRSHGYPVEIHKIQTSDGYILELHRIPRGINDTQVLNVPQGINHTQGVHGLQGVNGTQGLVGSRPVVFLQHCLLCSSSDWVINEPDKALGYILADRGYDVWLGNARGNTYSRNHVSLSPSEKKFWNFSWDEIAFYDIPASIDYVLEYTNSTRLNYIGFSMGTLAFYAMMSEKPEYNEKVNLMVALGPVAFLDNMNGPLAHFTRFAGTLKTFTDFFGIYEVLSGGMFLDLVTSIFCDPVVTKIAPICDDLLLRIIGMDTHYTNKRLLPQILSHTPAGTSVKNMIHFMQATKSGRFQKYSYGPLGNLRKYKSNFPPSYDLQKTKVPVALFWSENDWFANPKDVAKLSKRLSNIILNKKVPDSTFSHVDFLWSDTAVTLIYDDILKLFKQYS